MVNYKAAAEPTGPVRLCMELMAEQDTSLICQAAAITITAISAIWLIDCLILWPSSCWGCSSCPKSTSKLTQEPFVLLLDAGFWFLAVTAATSPLQLILHLTLLRCQICFCGIFGQLADSVRPLPVGQLNAPDSNVALHVAVPWCWLCHNVWPPNHPASLSLFTCLPNPNCMLLTRIQHISSGAPNGERNGICSCSSCDGCHGTWNFSKSHTLPAQFDQL